MRALHNTTMLLALVVSAGCGAAGGGPVEVATPLGVLLQAAVTTGQGKLDLAGTLSLSITNPSFYWSRVSIFT